jgi:predicted nucleotidyltransferase component of viral defense system
MTELKEAILERARKEKRSEMRLNRLRESLHHLLLQEADRKGAFARLCFVGGTALRILYGLDRFSEDLDFSVSHDAVGSFRLAPLAASIRNSLRAFGFAVEVQRMKDRKNVQSCFMTFKDGLLHRIDVSFPPGQTLAIRLEVDARPPAGAGEDVSPVTGERVYKVRHHDLPSLFAGKLHALLFRKYVKGRDLYDFLWYVGRRTPVNRALLQNAIEQTEGGKHSIDTPALIELLTRRFKTIDFKKAAGDVAPFLEDRRALELFDASVFLGGAEKLEVR